MELCKTTGIEIDTIDDTLKDLKNQFSFSTMTWAADLLANEMDIRLDPSLTQSEKNSIIASRWKGVGKCNLELIKAVCDSWENGEVEVTFIDGKIKLLFNGKGIPTRLEELKKQIEKVKPAHLIVDYLFRSFVWQDFKKTPWSYLKLKTWKEIGVIK